jgi:hypothetical protein
MKRGRRPFFVSHLTISEMSIQLSKFIIDEDDFERMVDTGYRTWFKDMSYAEFLEWNNKCICELTNEEDAWLVGLCHRLKNKHIQLQDMECCSRFDAYGFYFNEKKDIVIVNPR